MSKQEGLSAEEKKKRMLNVFYESKNVYNFKELEKAASEKGIVIQSVKEIVQSLVADGYVDTDKIGTSVYYWAFPSNALEVRNKRLTDLKSKKEDSQSKVKTTKESTASLLASREDTDERRQLAAEHENLQIKKNELSKQLARYADSDPDVIAAEKAEIEFAVDGANRWTDNVEYLRSWVKKKFNLPESEFKALYDFPKSLEYLETEPY